MSWLRAFASNHRGSTAAEFALLLPVTLFFLLGIIDVGNFAWSFNKAEEATQVGARYAAVTDMVPSGLYNYSFATRGTNPIPQGTAISATDFPGVRCTSNGTTATCTCASGGTCSFPLTADSAAFNAVVNQMNKIKGTIRYNNVVLEYNYSGLGYAGNPNGPDVAPIITVRLQNVPYTSLSLMIFGFRNINLPSASYSMTMEDGQGTNANY